MSTIYEGAIVEKRNILNEIRANNLSLQELRFFSIYLSKINPRDESTRIVRFPLSDFQKIMGFSRMNIQQLKSSTNSLLCKVVNIPKESGGYSGFQLFKECEVDKNEDGEWYVQIDAHDKALPLMFDFKERYFKYELWNALILKSANQIRMYEILKQYENIGKREMPVKELRELLGIAETEYSNKNGWSLFKKYVLDSCQKALKELTDISYTYERGKTGAGGRWISIVFTITKNEPAQKQIPIFEGFSDLIDVDKIKEETETQDVELDFFSGACNNEFSVKEMESLLAIVFSTDMPEHPLGIGFARYHYLQEQYTHFNAISEQQNIANRYSYFRAMLKAERDKQRENF